MHDPRADQDKVSQMLALLSNRQFGDGNCVFFCFAAGIPESLQKRCQEPFYGFSLVLRGNAIPAASRRA
jgi:hypothetical protein